MSNSRIGQLLKFLEATPNDSFLKFALALEYISQADDEKGLQYFKEILDNDPDYAGTYYHAGKLYERKGEKQLAEETYREGMKRTQAKDLHAYHELQEALNQVLFGEE